MGKWIGQHIYDLVARFRSDIYLEGISTSTETDMLVVDSNNKVSKRAASGLTSGTATLASTVTVTDSTTATAFPVVFHDESNALLDDTGAFTYNPSTGTLVTPNLTVSGTTTTINTTNLNVEDKNITLNYNDSSDTSGTADGAGITIQDAVDASNDASLTWVAASDQFQFSHPLVVDNITIGGDTITASADMALVATGNDITVDTDNFTIESAATVKPEFILKSTINSNKPATMSFVKDKGAAGANGDNIGSTLYTGDNDAQEQTIFAQVIGSVSDATDGAEEGKFVVKVRNTSSTAALDAFLLEGNGVNTNATIGYGANSVTTTAGKLSVTGTAHVGSSLVIADITNALDTCTIFTTTNGATTITTDENGASGNAHFEVAADGNITLDAAGDIALEAAGGDITGDADNYSFTSSTSGKPLLTLETTNTTFNTSAELKFLKDAANTQDNEVLGQIGWYGDNDAGTPEEIQYAKISARSNDVSDSTEGGFLLAQVYAGTQLYNGLTLEGNTDTNGRVDVSIAADATSVTTVAGDLTVNGTRLTLDHATRNDIKFTNTGDEDHYIRKDGDFLRFRGHDDSTVLLELKNNTNGSNQTSFPNGNHGIGTTNPGEKLEVDGNIKLSGNIELGHASDTTIARSASGTVTIEGNQVVTAGAVNVSSGSQSPIAMQVARRTITTGEANTMFTGGLSYAPIELIPAQGANTIIVPTNIMAKTDRAANQLNGSTTMDVHYDGQTGGYGASSLFHWRRFGFGETTDYVERRSINQVTSGLTLTEDVNKAVEISFNGGAPSTDCFTSIDIFITYYVLDIS